MTSLAGGGTKRFTLEEMDRATGTLLGQACGDALGVPYEFAAPLPTRKLANMIGGGLGPYEPGEWSDDTQMTICVAEVAATGADLSSDDALDRIAEGFLRWQEDGASDIGNQTRWVLTRARHGPGRPASRLRQAACAYAARHAYAAGNGGLMRTSIVGISALRDRDATATTARAIAELTHADPLAGDSCVLWSEAIRVAVLEHTLDLRSSLDLIPAASRDQWGAWIDEAETKPPRTFSPNGFTVTALQAAWAAVVQTDLPDELSKDAARLHLIDALQRAVHIGDDTDTVAAIAGGLLGGYWGASTVPDDWKGIVHGWPGLEAQDLVRLATLTVKQGISEVCSLRGQAGPGG